MKIELVKDGNTLVAKIPQHDAHVPLHDAVMQLYLEFDFEDEALGSACAGNPVDLRLTISVWRAQLQRLKKSYDYFRSPAVLEQRRKISGTVEVAVLEQEATPLTWVFEGEEFNDLKEIRPFSEVPVDIGAFTLDSQTLLVSDPCYSKGTWCTGELHAQTGKWNARTILRDDESVGHRNAILLVAHESLDINTIDRDTFEAMAFDVGVDSGQAGFFEKAKFPDDLHQLDYSGEGEEPTWYRKVADITLNDKCSNAGIVPGEFGVASQTFWGDGGYTCYVKTDDSGLVVAAYIVFDGSDTDEDDSDTDEDDSDDD